MIVRLMGEGQYRIVQKLVERLNEIDNAPLQALEAGDEQGLQARLVELHDLVRDEGELLDHAHLEASDLIVAPVRSLPGRGPGALPRGRPDRKSVV